MLSLLIIIQSFPLIISSHILNHCESVNDSHQSICEKCERGYSLIGSQCVNEKQQQRNCIQISFSGDCMRCDCGYSLVETGQCQLSPPDLIGCEVLKNNICVRPKSDYSLMIRDRRVEFIRFGRGSHCEIRNIENARCELCHSGYLLNKLNNCIKSKLLANEFFSYYSQDGVLQSRDSQFIVGVDGVYQQIEYCLEQIGTGDLQSSYCKKCQFGKVPNESKTLCFKPPFEECGVVSNQDQNVCLECIDNGNFYLKTNEKLNQQLCIQREQNFSEKCLIYHRNHSLCEICINGLVNTTKGCLLNNKIYLDDREIMKEQFWNSLNSGCYYFNDNLRCNECREGRVIDTAGNCKKITDKYCLIRFEKGGCKRCAKNMYYDSKLKKCDFVIDYQVCMMSTGESRYCIKCFSGYVLKSEGNCEEDQNLYCIQYESIYSRCSRCLNLFYLQNQICLKITEKYCLVSDGINNKCLKCKKFYFMDENSLCKFTSVNQIQSCPKYLFYSSEEGKCIEHSYPYFCFKFNEFKDECLECQNSFYLQQGQCIYIKDCVESNGINPRCIQSSKKHYLNEEGQIQKIEKECYSNGRDNICTSCISPDKSIGIYYGEECISLKNIKQDISSFCFLLEKQEDNYFCSLCLMNMYPNKEGICVEIDDIGCKLSDGRSNNCLLCNNGYKLDEQTKSCKLIEEEVPNCQFQQFQICKRCNNLFYLKGFLCFPISDPDCLESNGINDLCSVCNNGLSIIQKIDFNFCNFQFCKQYDVLTNNCIQCQDGFQLSNQIYQAPDSHPTNEIISCTLRKVDHCIKYNFQEDQCQECEKGYYLYKILYHTSCIQIDIQNCKDMSFDGNKCIECDLGYNLLPSGQCKKMIDCLEFKKECLMCTKDSFLANGQCFKIFNCLQQLNEQCFKCEQGYYLNPIKHSMLGDSFLEQLHEIIFDWCLQIPNCMKSDGISKDCAECESGYQLIHQTCHKIRETPCVSFDENINCMKCKNLFYLNDGECKEIEEKNCNISNGIDNLCTACQIRGFQLLKYQNEQCQKIPNCLISNGIDSCVLCKERYLINSENECIQFENQIDHCQKYSMSQTIEKIFGKTFSDQEIEVQEKIINLSENDNEEQDQNLFTLKNNEVENSSKLQCIECQKFYFIRRLHFNKCIKQNFFFPYCYQTHSTLSQCSVCLPQSILLRKKENNQLPMCVNFKKYHKLNNIGCKIFNDLFECDDCYPSFYLSKNKQCIQRIIEKPCLVFNPIKDECLQCNNGYVFMNTLPNEKICMKLESKQEVENCDIYQQNSNICKQCKKYLNSEIEEHYLNEQENKCEPIIGLMCHQMDPITKTCIAPYIPNCSFLVKNQDNSFECHRCSNNFYLDQQDKICKKHKIIEYCQQYDFLQMDKCSLCKDLSFLNQDGTCSPITTSHCLIAALDKDGCILCDESYSVDSESKMCQKSMILNCQLIKMSQQVCLKCRDNFVLRNEGKSCLFNILEINCEEFDENQECQKCKQDYLLTEKRDCIFLNSTCSIQKCLKFDNKSSQDNILCEECLPNYSLGTQLKCQPLDPESNIEFSNNDKHYNVESYEKIKIILLFFIILAILIFIIFIFYIFYKKRRISFNNKRAIEMNSFQEDIEKIDSIDISQSVYLEKENNFNQSTIIKEE